MTQSALEILLVEDNPDDVEMTLHALRKHRVINHTAVCRDGAEALDFLFCQNGYADRNPQEKPRMVLLDLKLPKVSGLEVLERVKADPRTRSIPVVALTSSQEDHDVRRAYELGVNSYIVKPVDFDGFAEAVRQLGLYWVLLNQPPRHG